MKVGVFRRGLVTLQRNVWLNVMSPANISASLDRSKIFLQHFTVFTAESFNIKRLYSLADFYQWDPGADALGRRIRRAKSPKNVQLKWKICILFLSLIHI